MHVICYNLCQYYSSNLWGYLILCCFIHLISCSFSASFNLYTTMMNQNRGKAGILNTWRKYSRICRTCKTYTSFYNMTILLYCIFCINYTHLVNSKFTVWRDNVLCARLKISCIIRHLLCARLSIYVLRTGVVCTK